MLVLIDNYDSFTYNLFQYFSELGQEVLVLRNDKATVEQIAALQPQYIVISPGPSTPTNAGISNTVIRHFSPRIPLLGVCLGHQCIGFSYGAVIDQAPQIMHGKSSPIFHQGLGVFAGVPSPFNAIRYHSLVVREEDLPQCLQITARTGDGTIMGLKHREYPLEGIQFHPESFMTQYGKVILINFLKGQKV